MHIRQSTTTLKEDLSQNKTWAMARLLVDYYNFNLWPTNENDKAHASLWRNGYYVNVSSYVPIQQTRPFQNISIHVLKTK